VAVIRSFRDKDTERLFNRQPLRKLGVGLQRAALRKLRQIDAAMTLEDLRVPPGNRLERLHADRAGQHSIRINDQWRLCFRWAAGDAHDVEIVDYHQEILMARKLAPVHPGEVLLKDFLEPLGLTQYRLSKGLSVPPRRINEIVLRKRAISADTALRLARFFGTSDRFWLNLQASYDLDVERDRLAGRLTKEVEVLRKAS